MVEELIIYILLLIDKIDTGYWRLIIEVYLKAFIRIEVDQAAISVVWRKGEVGQEIGSDDGLFDISNYKSEIIYLVAQGNSMFS